MKTLPVIVIALVLTSCTGSSSDKNRLLTAVTWTLDKASMDSTKLRVEERYNFYDDGVYSLEAGETKVTGTWKWIDDDEIFLATEGLTINGNENKFDAPSNSYIKIVELSEKNLKTLERHEGDAWESGFAKEQHYRSDDL